MMFQQRSILARKDSSERFRVAWTEPGQTWVVAIGDRAKGWPTLLPEKDHAFYVEVEQPPTAALTVAAHKYAQRTYSRMAGALNNVPALLTSGGRTRAYNELVADESKCVPPKNKKLSPGTFYKVVNRWLRGGAVISALAPEWAGNKKPIDLEGVDDMSLADAKRVCRAQSERLSKEPYEAPSQPDHTRKGLPRKLYAVRQPTRYKVDRATARVFRYFFSKKLSSEGRQSLTQAYDDLLRDVFRTIAPSGSATPWPDWVVPSYRQFEDWFNRMTTNRERRVALRGQHYFDLHERSLLGQGVSLAYTAGTLAPLDATVWNVTLVSDMPGAAVIGPPIVFRIRCADTGELLGLSVGLESASWMGAASAIANCVEDKVEFCKKFDIHIDADEWRVRGLPGTIAADCGETHNHKPNRFIAATNTNLKNLQRARGDLKPGVESDFNTLQVHLNGKTASAIVKSYEEKTMKQWRMKASMTLWQFTRVLLLAELSRMRTPRLGLQLPPGMIAAGTDTSPRSMWNYCAANMPTALRSFDEEEVRLSLLDSDAGSITEHGIYFKGIYYIAKSLVDAGGFEIARRQGRKPVTIAYDPRLVDNVYIMQGDSENPSGYVKCELNTRRQDQQGFAGKTFREVVTLIRIGDQQNHSAKSDSREAIDRFADEQKATIAASEARVKLEREAYPTNPTAQQKGLAAAREKEKNTASPKQAFVPPVQVAARGSAEVPAQKPTPTASQPVNSPNVVPILASKAKKISAFAARAAGAAMKPSSHTDSKTQSQKEG